MNKVSCDVISDLLPLYTEHMATEDSRALVEEHINQCTQCQEKLMRMKSSLDVPVEDDTAPLSAIKKKLFQKKLKVGILTGIFAVAVMILGYIYLTAPIPLAYDKDLISIRKLEDGALLVTVSAQVDDYMFDRNSYGALNKGSKDSGQYFYDITLWDSLWNRYISKNHERSFIINSDGEGGYYKVKAVYYYSSETDGSNQGNTLIYGTRSNDFDGMITLPRLALSYYFILAVLIAVVGGVALVLVRKHLKLRTIIFRFTMVPVSYVISQLCVKGVDFSTHTMLKDFMGIILLMIPIYFLLVIGTDLIRTSRAKNQIS